MAMTLGLRLRGALRKAADAPNTGGRGTSSGGAVTINKLRGKIVTESQSAAAGSTYTVVLTNSTILAVDFVVANVAKNASTDTGTPTVVKTDTSTTGACTITVKNTHASAAFNGAHVIEFMTLKHP
jgi:hypothetical protein